MISRGDNIVFDGTTFIGQSGYAPKRSCRGRVGIHLDPVRFKETVLGETAGKWKGTTVRNASFQNYEQTDTGCSQYSMPLKFFSHQTFVKAYNAPHYIENVQFDVPSQIDACMPGTGIDDLSVEILSDNNSALTPAGTAGFLVSPKLTPLVSTGCQAYNKCLAFCEGACLRTVTVVSGNAAFDDDLVLVVKRVSDGTTLKIGKNTRGGSTNLNRFDAAYTVALVKDSYEFFFESSLSPGVLSWPKYTQMAMEAAPSCTNHLVKSDISVLEPSSRPECDELIYNGSFDAGVDGWRPVADFSHHSIVHTMEGVGASGAILSKTHNPAQWIDATCIEAGDVFELSFAYKIVAAGTSKLPFSIINRNSFTGGTYTVDGEWTTVTDTWTVTDQDANQDKVMFRVGGGNQKILLDNVSIAKVGSRRQLRG